MNLPFAACTTAAIETALAVTKVAFGFHCLDDITDKHRATATFAATDAGVIAATVGPLRAVKDGFSISSRSHCRRSIDCRIGEGGRGKGRDDRSRCTWDAADIFTFLAYNLGSIGERCRPAQCTAERFRDWTDGSYKGHVHNARHIMTFV